MAKIFISYRRKESIGIAGRIYDRIRGHFGDAGVFMDVNSIPPGVNFRKFIATVLDQCDVMVVVIDRNWAGESETSRRLDDPRDFVRIELEAAFDRDLDVIPVLIDRTPIPGSAVLLTRSHGWQTSMQSRSTRGEILIVTFTISSRALSGFAGNSALGLPKQPVSRSTRLWPRSYRRRLPTPEPPGAATHSGRAVQ